MSYPKMLSHKLFKGDGDELWFNKKNVNLQVQLITSYNLWGLDCRVILWDIWEVMVHVTTSWWNTQWMTHEFMASKKRICNVDVDVFLFREVEFFPLRKTGKTGNTVFLDLFNDLMVFFSFTAVNHHQSTIWENMSYFFPSILSKSKSFLDLPARVESEALVREPRTQKM